MESSSPLYVLKMYLSASFSALSAIGEMRSRILFAPIRLPIDCE